MFLTKPQKTMLLCSSFIIGIGACLLNLIPALTVISVLFLSFLIYKKIISARFCALYLFILIFSVFYCNFKTPKPDELYKNAPANIYLKGRAITEPKLNLANRTKFEFLVYSYKLEKDNWKTTNAKTLVNIYDKEQKYKKILIGDVIEVKGFIKIPYEATNPGQFDYKNYLKNQEIFTLTNISLKNNAKPSNQNYFRIIEHPKSGKWLLIQSLNKIKSKIINENRKYIESPKLEVLEGMVFGDFAVPAPDEIKQEFIKSGLLHLLAASGMNVGFIFGAWFFIASKLNTPYKFKMITGAILVAFYALLTGVPPSIMRAAVMAEFLILAKLLDRKADTLIILIFVCTLMLLINPLLLANVSFQLSFITTFGILLCTQPLIEKFKPAPLENKAKFSLKSWWNSSSEVRLGAVIVPFIAQIWASPIQIYHFNNFSTYSLLANILVIPFVGIITFLGFTGSIFSFVPVIGGNILQLFDKTAEPVINIILFISGYISNLPHSLYYLAQPEISAIMLFYGFITALLFAITKDFSSKKLNITILILFLSLLVFIFKDNFDRKLEFVFFDVGQGDAILVHTPDNKNILVDTGPNGRYTPAKASIIAYLRDKGIGKLDAIVLTHQDSDHIGGTTEILENINVINIYHNGLTEDSKTSRKLKKYINEKHIKNKIISDGEKINLDKEVTIKVIRPLEYVMDSKENSDNEDSIILAVSYKDFSALLMGDCEADSIYNIKKYVKKPVDIIKIGHHGSNNSVNYDYLDYLKPQLAVISVGKRGYKYGHPNREVLEELKEFNVKTLRTDKDQAITITSYGDNYLYKTFKHQKGL